MIELGRIKNLTLNCTRNNREVVILEDTGVKNIII